MIDSWAIGVNIVLNDDILQGVARLESDFGRVQAAVEAINASLRMTGGVLSSLNSRAASFASAFSRAVTSVEALKAAMAGVQVPSAPAPTYAPQGKAATVAPAGTVETTEPTEDSGFDIPRVPPFANSQYFPGGAPSYGKGEDASAGEDEKKGGGHGGGINPLHAYIEFQIAKDLAGGVISGPFDAAATVDQQLAVLRNNGLTEDQAKAAYAQAQKMQEDPRYRTLTIQQLLDIFSGAYFQTRDVGDANSLMPELATAATVFKGMNQAGGAQAMLDLLRAGDLAGLLSQTYAKDTTDKDGTVHKAGSIDLRGLDSFIETFTKVVEVTGGEGITPDNILHLLQNAGPTVLGMDEQGREMMMLLSLSLGQQKAGTGINQMGKELLGGKMSIAVEKYLESLGLVDPKNVEPDTKHGGYVKVRSGSVKDSDLLERDPVAWFQKEIGGELAGMSPSQRLDLIGKIYGVSGTAQGARVVADSIFQGNMLSRLADAIAHMESLQTQADRLNQTPTGTAAAAGSATNALVVTLSQETMGAFKPVLNWYTNAANAVSRQVANHPDEGVFGVIDASLAGAWGALKGLGGVKWLGDVAKGASFVGDMISKLAEPIAKLELAYETLGPGSEKRVDDWGKELGLPAWMLDPHLLEHAFDDGNQKTVAAINNQTRAIVAALKGQQTPSMPTSPTAPTSAHSPGAPGQALPHY